MFVLTSPYIETIPHDFFSPKTRETFIDFFLTRNQVQVKDFIEGFCCPECGDWNLLFESTTEEYGLYLHTHESTEYSEGEMDGTASPTFDFPCSMNDGMVKLINELYDWEQGEISRLVLGYEREGKIQKSEEIKNEVTYSKSYRRAIGEAGYTVETALVFANMNGGRKMP